ncbi:MAG: UDP-glucose dehydrogenase family protein [Actinomycetota bacterium]
MKVVVIGVGHVGLVTAATMAHAGHTVVGLDDDLSKIEGIKRGEMPFVEPGLPELVASVTEGGAFGGKLTFESDYSRALEGAQVAFICVGTPARPDGEANLAAVEKAALTAAEHSTGDLVIVQKSTVPVMTADRLKKLFARQGRDRIHLASNPEFLREGSAVADSLNPDRILVGSDDEFAQQTMRDLYAPLVEQGAPYLATDIKTAELAKHACNAFLALKISYANALARICEKSGADVTTIADIMGLDRRIGRDFLNPGPGFGGYCLPKDVAAFKATASKFGYDFGLLDEVMKINTEATDSSFDRIKESLWNLEGKRVLLLGLSFKAGTDDTRESPSLKLAERLIGAGVQVIGYDPHAGKQAARAVPGLEIHDDLYAAAEGAHCIVICTRAQEFAGLDMVRLKGIVTNAVIVDACNLLDAKAMAESGFTYLPNGRPPVNL